MRALRRWRRTPVAQEFFHLGLETAVFQSSSISHSRFIPAAECVERNPQSQQPSALCRLGRQRTLIGFDSLVVALQLRIQRTHQRVVSRPQAVACARKPVQRFLLASRVSQQTSHHDGKGGVRTLRIPGFQQCDCFVVPAVVMQQRRLPQARLQQCGVALQCLAIQIKCCRSPACALRCLGIAKQLLRFDLRTVCRYLADAGGTDRGRRRDRPGGNIERQREAQDGWPDRMRLNRSACRRGGGCRHACDDLRRCLCDSLDSRRCRWGRGRAGRKWNCGPDRCIRYLRYAVSILPGREICRDPADDREQAHGNHDTGPPSGRTCGYRHRRQRFGIRRPARVQIPQHLIDGAHETIRSISATSRRRQPRHRRARIPSRPRARRASPPHGERPACRALPRGRAAASRADFPVRKPASLPSPPGR